MRVERLAELAAFREKAQAALWPSNPRVTLGMGTCGLGNGAQEVCDALIAAGARVKRAGCFGFCSAEPAALLYFPGRPLLLFTGLVPKDARRLAAALADASSFDRASRKAAAQIADWDFITSSRDFGPAYPGLPSWDELPFFRGQLKLVLRDCGIIDPESVADYVAVGGYGSLAKVLSGMGPEEVCAEVSASGLRGRGGAGFPAGRKWELMRAQPGEEKYVICNADEGDPGAYMNRNEIESDPHMLLEGMAIGAFATGARRGFVYVRAEYPLAVQRLAKALEDARRAGFLGERIMGTDFSLDLEMVQGAGAFVCGEETALIGSAEGRAGRPLPRPPFPAQRGFRGKPTTINNVETWCNVPAILCRGASWFRGIGSAGSPGTKVFSLVGKVRCTGLVELPLGTRLDGIVYGMGGGAGTNKRIKAVQTGGPSGGCIPASEFGSPVDYESLASLGAIMGSGGMVAMDRDNCMVDVARYFVGFTAAESCGKCAPCREGLPQMRRILEAISRGEGSEEDLVELDRLARVVRDSSLCALGQTAANPVLTTLRHFRAEYLRHIRDRRCDAGVCEALFQALCENSCPLHMNIPGYLALLAEGRIEEAYELTLRDNPLPGSLGRICHFHCQMRCRREDLDESVHQGEIHRYLADSMYKMGREKEVWARLAAEILPPSGKRVAIVGAGPAGLTAAFYLRRLGHEVTVYDAHAKAGGILRYGIPAYRLPKDLLDKELGLWKRLGVRFEFNAALGKTVSLAELSSASDAVLLCIGAGGDRELGIPGEELPGVHSGYAWLDALGAGKAPRLGKNVLVVGGGNVAVDAARSLLRLGSEPTIVYRRSREDLPANAAELAGAEEEGVAFRFWLAPERILPNPGGNGRALVCQEMAPGPLDSSGRPTPVPTGKTVQLTFDDLIVAVGERVDPSGIGSKARLLGDGRIGADPFSFQAGSPALWACGDAVTGPATAAEAMGQAKAAAREIDRALAGKERFASLFRDFGYSLDLPPGPSPSRGAAPAELSPEERRGNFLEVKSGYTGDQAAAEARRCLRCDIRSNARSPWR